jgi:hypothetical protein
VSNNDHDRASRQPIEDRAKELFDESVGRLDGRTRSALNQARQTALAELEGRQRQGAWRFWGPLSGVAAAALFIAVVFGPVWTTLQPPSDNAMPFEDFDIVADAENLALLEDLDFYAWLDTTEALPSG